MLLISYGSPRWRVSFALCFLCILTFFLWHKLGDGNLAKSADGLSNYSDNATSPTAVAPVQLSQEVELVVSSVLKTNTSWIGEHLPQYLANVYTADDPTATLTVPRNKGHESNVYLTHIINNYDHLPEILIFLHGRRYQWHNEDPLYDGVPPLQNLSIPYVKQHQFATLRCTWSLGCPREMTPDIHALDKQDDEEADDRAKTEAAYARAFTQLFPGEEIPEAVAVHCGAQFAATRDVIRQRSKEQYMWFRQWLYDTDLPDYLSGRVMEYAWHIILGQPPIACPHAAECFCQKFGLCDLSCEDYGCEKRYWFKFGELPDNWPNEGPGTDGWPEHDWAF